MFAKIQERVVQRREGEGGRGVYKYRGDGKVESRREERKGRGWIFFFFCRDPLYFPPLSFLFLDYTFFTAKLFFTPIPRNDPS